MLTKRGNFWNIMRLLFEDFSNFVFCFFLLWLSKVMFFSDIYLNFCVFFKLVFAILVNFCFYVCSIIFSVLLSVFLHNLNNFSFFFNFYVSVFISGLSKVCGVIFGSFVCFPKLQTLPATMEIAWGTTWCLLYP